MIRERLSIWLINVFCPPIAVMVVAGVGMDCAINTLFFIAGVIPGHIHAFYITCTYFNRKRKVRKGRWPGGRKPGVWSERVWNGDASNEKVRKLYRREKMLEEEKIERKRTIREEKVERRRSRIHRRE